MEIHPIYTRYKISTCGKVYDTLKERFLKSRVNDNGYVLVSLYLGYKKTKSYRVHRLVAETFLKDSKYYGLDVNHKDGNKQNNNLDNLEWCTRSYNIIHAKDNGLNTSRGETHVDSIYSEEQIREVCKLLEDGLDNTTIEAETKVSKQNITNIRTGSTWKHISSEYNINYKSFNKLTKEQVLEVYMKAISGNYTIKSLAEDYNVHRETISRIKSKKVHKRLIESSLNDYPEGE